VTKRPPAADASSSPVPTLAAGRGAAGGEASRVFAPSPPGSLTAEPAGLYVHVPFCSAICPYCDFAVARGRAGDTGAYVAALLREIEGWSAPGVPFDTVYFGGGTPTFLGASELRQMLDALAARFELTADVRVSLEANPEDVDEQSVAEWRALGVHTLSLGVQAFDDDGLRRLGRRHRREQAVGSVERAVAAGFDVVSVDLIYGLQGSASWRGALDQALAAGARHLSCYELTVHEGTPFWRLRERGGLLLADEASRADAFEATHRYLGERGWSGYEVSSFASGPDARSRHNQKYWRHVPYLGLGPSAHSFDGRRRWWNVRDWRPWAQQVEVGGGVAGEEELDPRALGLEALMLGLRTSDGVDLERYRTLSGCDLEAERGRELAELTRDGLVELGGGRLRPTLRGMAVAESLALRLAA
jgi:oxygen-independent coproporphyrinogen-3 oxidase